MTQLDLPLHWWSLPDWTGAIARPRGDGWEGFIVPGVAPHPLSLGKLVFEETRQGGDPLAGCPRQLTHRLIEEGECADECEPSRVRWVYVVGDVTVTALVAACFESGPGLVSGIHHFRHVPVGSFVRRGPQPDWSAVAYRALELKTGAGACKEQRIAV